MAAVDILAFDAPADVVYGQLRSNLERIGQPIGGNDLLLAAHAIAFGHTLVTDYEREFARVDDLEWKNWLR